ncbi:cilia- and flagella-associated protein 43 [Stomoxys calcitrans]|uniref:cilia- and flagella-associated protein 43 n=1 Tax=Stomoxys calcitrans TaxID=35570 RepID=UPI0027E23D2F|nr:cilia- and flagella-associated protein 43 [Stomoxys calcitrans]
MSPSVSVSWTSFASANSLINVGSEALCLLCEDILCFSDLKTKAISYYKADSAELGLGISAVAGHNRFSLVAFSEVVLRPSIHIIQYPKFTKYAVFTSNDVVKLVDIRFTEYDLLVALSGYPNHTLCIWNFRTGQLLCQRATMKESLSQSLQCSLHHTPQIVQYSEWNKQLMVWEICYTATDVDLHEISRITLKNEHALSNVQSMCYGEDNNLYIVDNFGAVSLVQIAQFFLKPQWSLDIVNDSNTVPKQFYICGHKQGLLVNCKDAVYYIRKKANFWLSEWQINDLPSSGLFKVISNIGGDIYASGPMGNLYQVEMAMDKATLVEFHMSHESVIDLVVIKTENKEFLLLLTSDNKLRALDLQHPILYSELEIPYGCAIAANNTDPYISVGTTTGTLHFLNYDNIGEPREVGVSETNNAHPLVSLQLLDSLALYRTIYDGFYLVHADFLKNKFYEMAHLVETPKDISVCKYFLGEESGAFVFVNRNKDIPLPHACEMWEFSVNRKRKDVTRQDYQLPHTYRDVTEVKVIGKDVMEFFAVRMDSSIIDIFNLKTNANELILTASIRTNHWCNISGIAKSTNLLTWGLDGTFIHHCSHKESQRPYGISEILQIKYQPSVVKKVVECSNVMYLVYLSSGGGVVVMKINPENVPTLKNDYVSMDPITVEGQEPFTTPMESIRTDVVVEHSPEELRAREELLKKVKELEKEVTALIDYDISVTGKTHGIYRKFCLNHAWLQKLIEEAKKLCEMEKKSLEEAIEDQSKIRDWIRDFIMANSVSITFKIRAIFSNFSFENYGRRKDNDNFASFYDLYRFYNMENIDAEDEEEPQIETSGDTESLVTKVEQKRRKYMDIQGSAYEHILSDELALQDIENVTANQMYNHDAKIRILLTDRLKEEFNKQFEEIRKIKFELMDTILGTNNALCAIYENMNCMLGLLKMDQFKPPELSVPQWQNDEFVQRIMEVDDSEIKAVNRRKKKAEITSMKHGRLLLWSVDFWARALVVMMDGVLEKLWQDEIKKDIPVPEFMLKKEPGEYTIEDLKVQRDYEEKVRLLTEDRKKYLKILTDNDNKVKEMKASYVLKLNEQIAQMMITKLKYDFSIKHVRLRNLNIKIMYFKKLQWLKRISMLRADIDKIGEYVLRYTKLSDFWSKAVEDLRSKGENLVLRDRVIERQFKTQYLNLIPQHMGPEMNKTFKKRPKLSPKILNSTLICKELSIRVNTKALPKYPFPLPKDVFEYLDGLNALDEPSSMPNALDPRYWEQLTKMRRQKVEMELKVKAVNLQLADSISGMNYFNKELANLKNTKLDAFRQLQEAQEEYLKSVQNQTLELRLTMGQVELNIMGSLEKLQNCILMNVDDINDINALILKAGHMKLKAMQRVAFFRRQVIYKEWKHKDTSANIEYLKFMLYVIEKCKVSLEFLNILRNWQKVKAEKQKMMNTVGFIEKTCEEKQISYRRQLERLNSQIASVRQQIDEMKRANKIVNRQIDDIKVAVAFSTTNRDFLIEEKKRREQNEKLEKLKKRSQLIDTVRRDYAHIMELKTILELQRLRTYPTLGPNPDHCMK